MSDTTRALAELCGCRSTDTRWVSLCNQHEAENREVRTRWQAEHEASHAHLLTTSHRAGTSSGAPAAPDLFT
jgi:hypothetical protein